MNSAAEPSVLLMVFFASIEAATPIWTIVGALAAVAGTSVLIITVFTRLWKKMRGVYRLQFMTNPTAFPPPNASSQAYFKSVVATNGEDLYLRIRIKVGVSIQECELQFVERKQSCLLWGWGWVNAPENQIHIERAWDAHAALIAMPEEPRAHERSNQVGGSRIVYNKPKEMMRGDQLWFRIKPTSSRDWEGYIQFLGPSPERNRSYVRGKVQFVGAMKPDVDTSDVQLSPVGAWYPEIGKDSPVD